MPQLPPPKWAMHSSATPAYQLCPGLCRTLLTPSQCSPRRYSVGRLALPWYAFPTADQWRTCMTMADLITRVATYASMSKADADAAVSPGFSTIADAFSAAIQQQLRSRTSEPSRRSLGPPARAAIPAQERPSPSRPPTRRRSRQARRFATPSTSGFGNDTLGCWTLPSCGPMDERPGTSTTLQRSRC